MHNLEVFTTKVCSKKTPKGNNLAELPWDIYLKDSKKKDNENESASVKTESRNQYLRKCRQSMEYSINMSNVHICSH